MVWIKLEESNMTVTSYYLKVIGSSFEKCGEQVTYKSNIKDIMPNAGDTVVLCTAPNVLRFLRKDIKVIYWAQGAWPEESMMRHSSKIRYFLTGKIERAALKRADFVFFVSEYMKKHFESKYKLSFNDNYYIMPCSNDDFHAESFEPVDKYKRNVFCYAGATSVWQCFEETVELYSKIESKCPESKLLLLVKDKEYALKVLEKYNVKNYEIDFVPVDQLPEKLKKVKYGFILRKPSVVNAVATPTKTLTYLSNGVIPVFSNSLIGISEIFSECNYKVEIQQDNNPDLLFKNMKQNIDKKAVLDEYLRIYDHFYNRMCHIDRISNKLNAFYLE